MHHFNITGTTKRAESKIKKWSKKITDSKILITVISKFPYVVKVEGRGALKYHMEEFNSKQIEQCKALIKQGLANLGMTEKEYFIDVIE